MNGLANGGFEDTTPQFPLPPGYSSQANHWISTATNGAVGITPTLPPDGSPDIGGNAMRLSVSSTAEGSAILIQNTVLNGGPAALTVGDSPVLGFWALGYLSPPISLRGGGTLIVDAFYYRLRYLDATGSALYDSGRLDRLVCDINNCQLFPGIQGAGWGHYSFRGDMVPAGAVSAEVEFSLFGLPNFDDPRALNHVNLDGITLTVTAVPEPESYALMLAGLGFVGAVVRRRRRSC